MIDVDNDSRLSSYDSSMALVSIDTNEILSTSSSSNHKRSLESPSTEQVLIKRRIQKSVPSNFHLMKNKIIESIFF